MFTKRPVTQYKHSVAELNKLSFDKEICFKYLHPELTTANNVHYHGVIVLPHTNYCYANWAVHEWFRGSKCFGYLKLVELKDPDGWLEYCTKQEETIKDLLTNKVLIKPYTAETKIELEIEAIELEVNMAQAAGGEREAYRDKPYKPVHLEKEEEDHPGDP